MPVPAWHSGGVGAPELDEAIEDRAPSPWYFDGANSAQFYRSGRAVLGRPYVMVHKGERTRARVGAFSTVGPDVVLMVGGNHRIDWVPTFALREMYDLPGAYEGNPGSRGDIEIGADVALGRAARVLSGVTVGHGAVVLPHAVVTKDVRPFAVVAGCPAREVGRRFADADVVRLLALAWWDWPAERVLRELHPPPATWRHLRAEVDERNLTRRTSPVDLSRPRGLAGRALRKVALKVDPRPPPPTPSDIPTEPWSYDTALLQIGYGQGSSCPPVVHHDGSGRHRATIGNFSSVAYDCELILDTGAVPSHISAVALGLDPEAGSPPSGGDIVVGSDVWLTRGARILPGVTIGHGAVVAAYAVVTEDVRPYAIVAGNPARETSRRFDDETVEALLEIAWWGWSEDLVRERYADLCTPDVRSFVDRYRARV